MTDQVWDDEAIGKEYVRLMRLRGAIQDLQSKLQSSDPRLYAPGPISGDSVGLAASVAMRERADEFAESASAGALAFLEVIDQARADLQRIADNHGVNGR